jgi:zinc transport system substrate-binding protein
MNRAALGLAAALALGSLAACSSDPEGSDDRITVVAAMYPLQYVAERIAGDTAAVETLTSPGTEPHDVELTVAQTAAVIEADVVLYLEGFQSAVDGAVTQSESEHVVDAADAASLVAAADEAHVHDESESARPAAEGEETDPHFWLDPTRLAAVAEDVGDALAEADPARATTYAANLEALLRDLERLDSEIAAGLDRCERDAVVVSHNAFQYWGDRYGLDMHAIAGLSPESEPSPQHIAELLDLIESEGVTTVFSETLASPEMAETLSADLGLETGVLDPVEGLSDETADEDYLSLMRANLGALRKANGC